MPKIPVLQVARKLERAFRPHDLVSVDNGYHVFTVAYQGVYAEHQHSGDEFIYVLEGVLNVQMAGEVVELRQGEGMLIPAGVRHKPSASGRALAMIFERRGLQAENGLSED